MFIPSLRGIGAGFVIGGGETDTTTEAVPQTQNYVYSESYMNEDAANAVKLKYGLTNQPMPAGEYYGALYGFVSSGVVNWPAAEAVQQKYAQLGKSIPTVEYYAALYGYGIADQDPLAYTSQTKPLVIDNSSDTNTIYNALSAIPLSRPDLIYRYVDENGLTYDDLLSAMGWDQAKVNAILLQGANMLGMSDQVSKPLALQSQTVSVSVEKKPILIAAAIIGGILLLGGKRRGTS